MGFFIGDAGNNVLVGTDDFDLLNGLAGNDTMKGGKGDDSYTVDSAKDVVVEAVGGGKDTVFSNTASYTLSANIERLVLSAGALNGTGNALGNDIDGNEDANVLKGLGGDDELDGNGGPDILDGGAGNDTLIDSGDADTLKGGTGNDLYRAFTSNSIIVEAAGAGIDEVEANGISFSLLNIKNVENLTLLGTANTSGTGNALANKITGNASTNILSGNEGNDTLDGGAGADIMAGGAGNDTYIVDDQDDSTIEGAGGGKDRIMSVISFTLSNSDDIEELILTGVGGLSGTGNKLANVITGNASSNDLDGADGNDTLNGGTGEDVLTGGLGRDVLVGGKDNDVYFVDDVADKVIEQVGIDRDRVHSTLKSYTLGANVENLFLEAGASTGNGNGLNNELRGNDAANTLNGAGGDDLIDGDEGNDTLSGGAGNDDLNGEGGIDLLDGGAGDDFLIAIGGTDTLKGGIGNDTYQVSGASSTIIELANGGIDGVEALGISFSLANIGFVENLSLLGQGVEGTGNDLSNAITGNAGANVLDGGKGNDTLDGGLGADTLTGGLGNDTYLVEDAGDDVIELPGEGKDTVLSSVAFSLVGQAIEVLTLLGLGNIGAVGNDLDNVITGNQGRNTLMGNDGNDTLFAIGGVGLGDDLFGGTGNDTLKGSEGTDLLNGGSGNDSMAGGKGDDDYVVDSIADKIVEGANAGRDEVESSIAGYTLGANVEDLRLVGAAINGTGNGLANRMTGNGLANKLDGGAGNDDLAGLGGNDTLSGGIGDDILEGGAGSDTMSGGAGKDIFFYDDVADLSELGPDLITDFARGFDKIDLSELLEEFQIDPDEAFAEGHILLSKSGKDTVVQFDVDSNGSDPATLAIVKGVTLTQADFLLTELTPLPE